MPMTKRGYQYWPTGTRHESEWYDPRTKLRLAPGAMQNWPSKEDDKYIKHERGILSRKQYFQNITENSTENSSDNKQVTES